MEVKHINCKKCLINIRKAMDPVRYDWAVSMGLLKEP